MFEEHFEFSVGEDYFYRVDEIAPTNGNGEQEFTDVETGLDEAGYSWVRLADDDSRRRGRDALYLVEGDHYVWCSITGMESAGNTVRVSAKTPERLRFAVLSGIFEGILSRRFGDISEGIDGDSTANSGISIMTPGDFVLSIECEQEELEEYHDEYADMVYDLIESYHEVESVDELQNLVEGHSSRTTDLFHRYTSDRDNGSILGSVLPEYEAGDESWRFPNPEDIGKWEQSAFIMYWEGKDVESDEDRYIDIRGDKRVQLSVESDDTREWVEKTYSSPGELVTILDQFTTPGASPNSFSETRV